MNDSAPLTDNVVSIKKDVDLVCPFCARLGERIRVDEWAKNIDTHLVITISDIGTKQEHCHLHGCVNSPALMLRMMEYIKREIDKAPVEEKK